MYLYFTECVVNAQYVPKKMIPLICVELFEVQNKF